MIGPQSDTPHSFPASAAQSTCACAKARVAESSGMGCGACARAAIAMPSISEATATDDKCMELDLRDEDATGCDHSWVFLRDSSRLVSQRDYRARDSCAREG